MEYLNSDNLKRISSTLICYKKNNAHFAHDLYKLRKSFPNTGYLSVTVSICVYRFKLILFSPSFIFAMLAARI